MDATTTTLLLVIAIILAIISVGLIALGLRPKPRASQAALWPPAFFHPMASDASFLTPRKTQTGSAAMQTQPNLMIQPVADEEPTARKLDLQKVNEAAERANQKRAEGSAAIPASDPEVTNKNAINPAAGNDADATGKQIVL